MPLELSGPEATAAIAKPHTDVVVEVEATDTDARASVGVTRESARWGVSAAVEWAKGTGAAVRAKFRIRV